MDMWCVLTGPLSSSIQSIQCLCVLWSPSRCFAALHYCSLVRASLFRTWSLGTQSMYTSCSWLPLNLAIQHLNKTSPSPLWHSSRNICFFWQSFDGLLSILVAEQILLCHGHSRDCVPAMEIKSAVKMTHLRTQWRTTRLLEKRLTQCALELMFQLVWGDMSS